MGLGLWVLVTYVQILVYATEDKSRRAQTFYIIVSMVVLYSMVRNVNKNGWKLKLSLKVYVNN